MSASLNDIVSGVIHRIQESSDQRMQLATDTAPILAELQEALAENLASRERIEACLTQLQSVQQNLDSVIQNEAAWTAYLEQTREVIRIGNALVDSMPEEPESPEEPEEEPSGGEPDGEGSAEGGGEPSEDGGEEPQGKENPSEPEGTEEP